MKEEMGNYTRAIELEVIATHHPETDKRNEAGRELVKIHKDDPEELLKMVESDKRFTLETRGEACKKLRNYYSSKKDFINLIRLSKNPKIPSMMLTGSVKESGDYTLEYIEKCDSKDEFWNLLSLDKSDNLPLAAKNELGEILERRAVELADMKNPMDREAREKFKGAEKERKPENGKKARNTA